MYSLGMGLKKAHSYVAANKSRDQLMRALRRDGMLGFISVFKRPY